MPAYDGDYHVHPGVFQYSLNKNYNVFKGACRGTRAFLICRNLSISAACVCRGPPFQSVTRKPIGKENSFMNEEDWVAIIEDEDRLIANSDRRFRYHCYSLENMSEELTYQERSLYVQEDFTSELLIQDFIDTVRNEKLAFGLRRLTDRQRHAIELAFWEGYQYKEIATVFQCSPAAVTLLLQRAFHRLREYLNE